MEVLWKDRRTVNKDREKGPGTSEVGLSLRLGSKSAIEFGFGLAFGTQRQNTELDVISGISELV